MHWHEGLPVDAVFPDELRAGGQTCTFDWVADTRGIGAKADIPQLRGARGEIVTVQAPEVQLNRMVRLMHPRYAIYIAPRPEHQYVIGATSIESEDRSPISVQSLLELLSAAYTVHSGFAEARLLKTATQLRPALPDHLPRIFYRPGLLRINGLYRHGYLQGPAVVEDGAGLCARRAGRKMRLSGRPVAATRHGQPQHPTPGHALLASTILLRSRGGLKQKP